MNAENAKMAFAGVKQVKRYDNIDLTKAEYATIQVT